MLQAPGVTGRSLWCFVPSEEEIQWTLPQQNLGDDPRNQTTSHAAEEGRKYWGKSHAHPVWKETLPIPWSVARQLVMTKHPTNITFVQSHLGCLREGDLEGEEARPSWAGGTTEVTTWPVCRDSLRTALGSCFQVRFPFLGPVPTHLLPRIWRSAVPLNNSKADVLSLLQSCLLHSHQLGPPRAAHISQSWKMTREGCGAMRIIRRKTWAMVVKR